jgi:hypothetical protein
MELAELGWLCPSLEGTPAEGASWRVFSGRAATVCEVRTRQPTVMRQPDLLTEALR